MKNLFVILFCVHMYTQVMGQVFEKIIFDDKNPDDYYLMLRPITNEINGVLVLLPGYGEDPESIFPESKLFNVAYANGILTLAIAGGQKLYADEKVTDKLNRGINDFLKRNPSINKDKFIIGGYSAGGTISLRYAQYCAEKPDKFPISPRGVFAVDSPVDLFDIWDYFQREIEKNYSQAGVFEAKFVTEIMRKEIGTPASHEKVYSQLTPFDYRLKEPGNEKYLKNIAVRVYEDIDMSWQLHERRRSSRDTNMFMASELINRLLINGNDRAEFMTSKTPGYRSSGMRHPHSWSIVDEVEFMQWALKLFK